MWQYLETCTVCVEKVCDFKKKESPTRIDLKKGAGETVLYFLYMLLPVSLQRSWIYTFKKKKKESSSSTKNTAQDQSALVFSFATYNGGYYAM